MAHSWFQAVATNESLYEYMDEVQSRSATAGACVRFRRSGQLIGEELHQGSFSSYISQALSGNEEPLVTHADHYVDQPCLRRTVTYSKGSSTLLAQLAAVMVNNSAMKG